MAGLQKLKSGAYRITITRGEQQKSIHLGKVNKKTAELIQSNVERIIATNAAGVSLDEATARWTKNIDDTLHGKLVKAGVLSQRQRRTLGKFVADYVAEQTNWKPGTRRSFTTATKKMLVFFGTDTLVEKITVDNAVAFRLNLELQKKKDSEERKYSEATISKIVKRCRQVFKVAKQRKLLADNPFETVKGGSERNPERQYPVSVEETQALIDACNSPKQRLIIALARWGGLRCPSELVGLKWSEVNWGRSRFIVHSPKTEKQGKSQRAVPIFKELYPFLLEASEAAPENEDRVFPEITDKKSLGSFIARLAKRAGIPLWEKPFQNMRSTRATELIEEYPAHVVNYWLGHSEAVAMAHYRQTGKAIDKFYEQAAGQQPTPIQNFTHEHAGIGCFGVEGILTGTTERVPFYPTISRLCSAILHNAEDTKNASMTPTGIEPVPRP